MAAKKATAKKTASATETAVKAAEKEAVKAVEETVEAAEKDAVKAEETAKKAAEKAPAKKTTAKKVEKDMTTTLTIEYNGKDVTEAEIIEKVKADFAEKSGSDKEIESLQLYVQPSENKVYYVADGVGGEEYSVEL